MGLKTSRANAAKICATRSLPGAPVVPSAAIAVTRYEWKRMAFYPRAPDAECVPFFLLHFIRAVASDLRGSRSILYISLELFVITICYYVVLSTTQMTIFVLIRCIRA